MLKFTKSEIKYIENDIKEILDLYDNDEEFRKGWLEFKDDTGEIIQKCSLLLDNIDKINIDKEINALPEEILWISEFHIYTLRGWDINDVGYIAGDDYEFVPKHRVELYRKFYGYKKIDGKYTFCYLG